MPAMNPPTQPESVGTPPQTPRKRKISMRLPSSKSFKKLAKAVKTEVRELVGLAHHVTPPIQAAGVPVFGPSLSFVPSPSPSPSSSPARRRTQSLATDVFGVAQPPPPPRSRTSSATLSVRSLHLPKPASGIEEGSCTASSIHTFRTDSDSLHSVVETVVEEQPTKMDVSSPPLVYVEPPVPDPFLVDDPEDPLSDEESKSQQSVVPPSQSEEILIKSPPPASPSHLQESQILPLPNLDKAIPQEPQQKAEEQEEDAEEEQLLEIALPGLVLPTMFLPIPNTDPLTTLLTKYIPPEKRPARDLTGEWQRSDFHTLVMSNSWRALARMARDRIVTTDPEELGLILSLWYIRLASLARLRLFNQTSAECTNLFTVLNAIEPQSSRDYVFERILPFELEVMYARLKYWIGDHMGYLDALHGLLRDCRNKARKAKDEVTLGMWKERGARMCLIIASQLIEMKDYMAAAKLLEPLCKQDEPAPAMRSAIGRIYLQAGYVKMAEKHFRDAEKDGNVEQAQKDMNAALLALANGDWETATSALERTLKEDEENYAAVNNLSVALLSQGRLKEAIEVLERPLATSPSAVVVAEPFLFNLSTLYELRSGTALDKKRGLLVEVAKWSGDGLKTACLKMPTS